MAGRKRPLSSLPFSPAQRAQLTRGGFETVLDLLDVSVTELSKELEISQKNAVDILEVVKETTEEKQPAPLTALDLLAHERKRPSIVTLCPEWDALLGGGIPLMKLSEFCGAPGVGKTQLGMQLAFNVQIPVILGGIGGEAIYIGLITHIARHVLMHFEIDTEGSFIVERARDIAQALVNHIHSVSPGIENFNTESVLSAVHYFRVHNYVQQLAVIQMLPEFIKEHAKVKLIVVDSVAFHFRRDFHDMALRTRLLNGMAQQLLRLATSKEIAIVLMNQMTTKKNANGKSQLVPALGESWGHASTLRVILYCKDGVRKACLYKSPFMQEGTIEYAITVDGIRSAAVELQDSKRRKK
eukprot:m.67672 g.67672  ORF g.67672 m.67672 type:complete len:355 (+) comp11906_c0_seq4:140-1204(+)